MSETTITLRYTGTGLGMLWRVILGFFLMMITLGIYYPWFMNSLIGYACSHVEVNDPPGGIQPNVRFTGSGLGLLLRFIVWYFLTYLTLGLFAPWALNGIFRYAVENIEIDPG